MRIFGFEISNTPSQGDFLKSRRVDLVLDVGANTGQYAKGTRVQGYKGTIHSFEPVSSVYNQLTKNAAKDPQWKTSHCAVGSTSGTATINVSRNTVYSSILAQTSMAADFSYKSKTVRQEDVPLITLDDFPCDGARSIFLKIDTQGYEKEVLMGATSLLPRVVGVQLELPVEHLYENVWSFSDAVKFMDDLGFTPAQFRVVNPIHDDPVAAIEFDCIFRRKR